jgi:hypothetical protein
MGRMIAKVMVSVGFLSCLAVPVVGGEVDAGFLTNLGLLNRLTEEAVSALIDSLAFLPGEKITVVTAAYSEGNDFIAEALARELSGRGVEVRLATESAPAPAPEQPPAADRVPPVLSDTTKAGSRADTLSAVIGAALTEVNPDSSAVSPESIPPAKDEAGGAAAKDETDKALMEKEKQEAEKREADKQEAEKKEAAGGEAGNGEAAGAQEGQAVVKKTPPTTKAYPAGTVLEYRVLEFGISYPFLKRKYFIAGDASVRRLAGVFLVGSRIQGPDGTVLKVAKAQSHQEDMLPSRARVRAEGATYPFTKPVVPPANVGKYIEPIAVVGIITSLVYLFYQNQN